MHPPGHVPHVPQGAYETGYFVLATLFVAMLMLTNVIGTKLFSLPLDLPLVGPLLAFVDGVARALFGGEAKGHLTLTAGIVTYPVTFLITDIVSEIYGRRRADRMVWLGFFASLLMLAVVSVGRALPPDPGWYVPEAYAALFRTDLVTFDEAGRALSAAPSAAQGAWAFTFDAPGTLLFASMLAYVCAQLVDNRLFHFWRALTGGRHLWFRNNMSTTISQLVDTALVLGIFLRFYWKMGWAEIGAIALSVYAAKFLLALLDTPLCYLGVFLARRLTGAPPPAR